MNRFQSDAPPEYSILIVGFRSLRFLEDCLESLLRTAGPAHEILFLDNDSPEPEAEWVEGRFPDSVIRVFRSQRNLLFAGGVNFLAARSSGRFLVLLNPDARVDSEWLAVLDAARRAGHWEAAQLDLRSAADPSERETQGQHLDRLGFIHHVSRPEAARPFRIFSGRGAGVMIERAWFLDLGGLDEDMGMYFEETDFFWRLNISGGRMFFIPGAKVYHVRGGSSNEKGFDWRSFRFTRNRMLSLAKNLQFSNLAVFLPAHLLIYTARVLGLVARLRVRQAVAESAALLAALVMMPRFFRKRGAVSRSRRLTDRELIEGGFLLSPGKPRLWLRKRLKMFGFGEVF